MSVMEMLREVHKEVRVKSSTDMAVENVVFGRSILQNPARAPFVQAIIDEIRPQVYQASTDQERVKLMKGHFCETEYQELLKTIDNALIKHELLALKFKERSFMFYDELNYEMAIRCSNLGLLFAPGDSDLFPKLYATRALFLHALKDWKPAINDIDKALGLAEDFPKDLTEKLSAMKAECLEFCKEQTLDSETEKRQNYCDEFLFKVFGEPNLSIPGTGDYIMVDFHPVKGRTLVVTENLDAGTTIIVEEPFASVLTESTKWEVKHCAFCYKKTRALVPCPHCVHTTYCSDRCRLEDYDGIHKFECPCLNYFNAVRIPPHMQMSCRAICRAGPEYMFQLFNQSRIDNDQNNSWQEFKGFDSKTGRYDSDNYFQIHNLMSHPPAQLLEVHTFYSYHVAQLLNLKTNFFEKIDVGVKENFIEFIASCILRNFLSFENNSMELVGNDKPLKERKDDEEIEPKIPEDGFREIGDEEVMIGVFSFASLLCHSCDPSALRINLPNGKLAIITNRKLRVGEDVTISYGCEFSTHFLENRIRSLMKNFNFKCDCLPCIEKWPTLDDLPRSVQHLCPSCSRQFPYREIDMLKKCVLKIHNPNVGTCGNCKKDFEMSILKKELKKYGDVLENAHDLLITEKPVEAIPLLVKCIEFFQDSVLLPFLPFVAAQVYLLKAYELITKSTSQ